MSRRYWLAIVLVTLLFTARPRPTRAQGTIECNADFPSGWTVVTGSVSGTNIKGAYVTISGDNYSKIEIYQELYPQAVFNVTAAWFMDGFTLEYPGTITVILSKDGVNLAQRTITRWPFVGAGSWFDPDVFQFSGEIADKVTITISRRIGLFPGDTYIHVYEVCSSPAITATPSPTFEIIPDTPTPEPDTPTPTLTATATPGPTQTPSTTPSATLTLTPSETLTPSATLTPSETNTPGGPTPTATAPASSTAPASATIHASATTTKQGLGAGNGIFGTIPAPKGCKDPFNPCGVNPFPVPGFATLSLASPTAYRTPTANGTQLQTPVLSGSASPTGTAVATATGTEISGIIELATQVAGIPEGFRDPPVFTDAAGDPIDLRNAIHLLGNSIGQFFGFLRSLNTLFSILGRAGALLAFMLLDVAIILLLRVLLFAVPVILALLRWLFRALQLIRG